MGWERRKDGGEEGRPPRQCFFWRNFPHTVRFTSFHPRRFFYRPQKVGTTETIKSCGRGKHKRSPRNSAELAVFGGNIRALGGEPTVDDVESEMLAMPHLENDRRRETRKMKRELRDARQAESAAEAIGRIPGPDEAIHLVVCGKFSLWDSVPAVLTFARPATIANLHIATLGFSKNNIAALCVLLDSGWIREVSLLCSHYFQGTSTSIYDFAAAELATRRRTFQQRAKPRQDSRHETFRRSHGHRGEQRKSSELQEH